jgi:starch synthase
MNIVILTNEYPPNIYGGAGVHVEYLSRALARLAGKNHHIQVFCFGNQDFQEGGLSVKGISASIEPSAQDPRHKRFMDTILRNVLMTGSVADADIIHCHTWYSHLAGVLLKQLTGAKLVLTTHSLEPHRPWKAEQLGTAYRGSSWIEMTAYQNSDGVIAVSQSMQKDVSELYGVPLEKIRVIHNGIDLSQYKPSYNPEILRSYDIDPNQPFILFVGRITRQKGIIHLVNAIEHLKPGIQIVLCAGAPDTEEIGLEMFEKVRAMRHNSPNPIIWIQKILPREEVITLYTHASLFVCPSVYEPFGIINLEAMACETPVVGTAVGGIPEIIVDGETGKLVPMQPAGNGNLEPRDPETFARELAEAINELMLSPEDLQRMGRHARRRVEAHFSWSSIGEKTMAFYEALAAQ